MNIGQASKASGVHAKMIRYYERIGLIPKAGRTEAGYRVYTDAEVNTLRFIHRAREFGMPIERIRRLVSLWQGKRPSREVKEVALEQVAELERKVAELTAMRDALQHLAACCDGDHRPECPILRDFEASAPARIVPEGPSQPSPVHSLRAATDAAHRGGNGAGPGSHP